MLSHMCINLRITGQSWTMSGMGFTKVFIISFSYISALEKIHVYRCMLDTWGYIGGDMGMS